MDFRLNEEQQMIAEAMGTALNELCPTTQLRKMIADARDFDPERWQALAELAICGILIPDAQGGLGLSEVEFALIAEHCGSVLLPEPLVQSSGIALPLLSELGERVPNALAEGKGHAVLVHPLNPLVTHAPQATAIVVADDTGNLSIGTPEQMQLTAQPSADPLAGLFSVLPGPGARNIPASDMTRAALARATDRGALFAAAQMLGIAQGAVAIAVAYAKERQQFGRPIGANQAIKHMLAEVQVEIEFLRPVLMAAAAMLRDASDLSRAHISHARLRAAELVDRATRTAVQVHGAMGYSWETNVHLYLKRGLILSQAWGGRDYHLHRVALRAFGSNPGPDTLFAHV